MTYDRTSGELFRPTRPWECLYAMPMANGNLKNLWDRVVASLWFVPVLCTLGGICSAVVLLACDYAWDDASDLPFWLETTTDGAQTVLSTISGGMITVAGVVLSMTMVTLSITSSQFGSRVLRTRIRDRTTPVDDRPLPGNDRLQFGRPEDGP